MTVIKLLMPFATQIRQRISDFGVLLAILIMVGVDIAVGINTPKLIVPEQFKVRVHMHLCRSLNIATFYYAQIF